LPLSGSGKPRLRKRGVAPGPPKTLDASKDPAASSRGPVLGPGLLMDRFATPSECREQAALCRTRADAAADERLRAVCISMALIWTKLAAHKEQPQRLNAQGA
jgi:hypothetical protein